MGEESQGERPSQRFEDFSFSPHFSFSKEEKKKKGGEKRIIAISVRNSARQFNTSSPILERKKGGKRRKEW